jgi:hypothetical protein
LPSIVDAAHPVEILIAITIPNALTNSVFFIMYALFSFFGLHPIYRELSRSMSLPLFLSCKASTKGSFFLEQNYELEEIFFLANLKERSAAFLTICLFYIGPGLSDGKGNCLFASFFHWSY